jgi:hypothetical protein
VGRTCRCNPRVQGRLDGIQGGAGDARRVALPQGEPLRLGSFGTAPLTVSSAFAASPFPANSLHRPLTFSPSTPHRLLLRRRAFTSERSLLPTAFTFLFLVNLPGPILLLRPQPLSSSFIRLPRPQYTLTELRWRKSNGKDCRWTDWRTKRKGFRDFVVFLRLSIQLLSLCLRLVVPARERSLRASQTTPNAVAPLFRLPLLLFLVPFTSPVCQQCDSQRCSPWL